jgi:hypothetical protein
MPLTLRPTGRHSPVYADRQDWTIFDGGKPVGRISSSITGIASHPPGRPDHHPAAERRSSTTRRVKKWQGRSRRLIRSRRDRRPSRRDRNRAS